MIKNPIFLKEFSRSIKSWQTNLVLWAYLLILSCTLLLLWPGSGVISLVSQSGKQIFFIFFAINLTLMLLIVPAFSASSVTSEKENDTYSSLFMTLLSPTDIMLGKLSASLAIITAISFFAMPIASICALTGGISLVFLFKIMIVILLTAVSYGLIGLACSVLTKQSSSSIILNYVLILLFAGGTWLPASLLGNLIGFKTLMQYIKSISPYDAIFFLFYPESYYSTMEITSRGSALINPFTIFIVASILISAVSFLIFYSKILSPEGKAGKKTDQMLSDRKKLFKRKLSWPFYLIDPLKRKKNIRGLSNPVFVAEMRSKLFANPKFILRAISIIFILSLGLMILIAVQFGISLQPNTVKIVSIIFQLSVVALLAPGVSSGLITDERSAGTFVSLRLTPLKPWTVIFGKLKATLFYALIFIISSLFILIAMAFLEIQNVFPGESILSATFWTELLPRMKNAQWWSNFWTTYRSVVLWAAILLVSTVTFLTAGLCASAFSKRTGIATAISYIIAVIISIVTFAPIILQEKLSMSLQKFILSFNPAVAAMQLTSDSFSNYPGIWKNNIIYLLALSAVFLIASILRTWYLFNKQE